MATSPPFLLTPLHLQGLHSPQPRSKDRTLPMLEHTLSTRRSLRSCQPQSPPCSEQNVLLCKSPEVLACLHIPGWDRQYPIEPGPGHGANAGTAENCRATPTNLNRMDKTPSREKTGLMAQRRGAFSRRGHADCCSLSLKHAVCLRRSQRAPPLSFTQWETRDLSYVLPSPDPIWLPGG